MPDIAIGKPPFEIGSMSALLALFFSRRIPTRQPGASTANA